MSQTHKAVAAIILFALILRLAVLPVIYPLPPQAQMEAVVVSDATEFRDFADHLVRYGPTRIYDICSQDFAADADPSYVTTFRPPLYPILIAISFSLFGRSIVPVALAQIALDIIALFAIFHLGRRLGGTDRAGLAPMLLHAINPLAIIMPALMLAELVFHALFIAALVAFYLALKKPALSRFAAAGATLGLCALTKIHVVYLLPSFLLGALWGLRGLGTRRALTLAACMLLLFGAVTGVWQYRNQRCYGYYSLSWLPDRDILFQNAAYLMGRHKGEDWRSLWPDLHRRYPTDPYNPFLSAQKAKKAGWRYILGHKAEYVAFHLGGASYDLFLEHHIFADGNYEGFAERAFIHYGLGARYMILIGLIWKAVMLSLYAAIIIPLLRRRPKSPFIQSLILVWALLMAMSFVIYAFGPRYIYLHASFTALLASAIHLGNNKAQT